MTVGSTLRSLVTTKETRFQCLPSWSGIHMYDMCPRWKVRWSFLSLQNFTCFISDGNFRFLLSQFLVGSGTGDLFHVDARGKNSFVGKFKGFTGAVKDVACPPNQSLIFSVSLDRHFRIHDFSTRKLLLKVFIDASKVVVYRWKSSYSTLCNLHVYRNTCRHV